MHGNPNIKKPVCIYVEEWGQISPMFIMSLTCISRQGNAVHFGKELRSTLPLTSEFSESLMHVSHARFTWQNISGFLTCRVFQSPG